LPTCGITQDGAFVGEFVGAVVDVILVILNVTWNDVPAIPVALALENGVAVTT
jgi:hypothetical protein